MNRSTITTLTAAALTVPLFASQIPSAEAGPIDFTSPAVTAGVDTTKAAKLDDPTIVAIFDAANTADIETGELAVKRAQNKEVRDFGAMLARDHKLVRQQGRDLAKKLGVTPTPPANDASAKAHTKAMETLRATKAGDFDHAFLQHEIAFHKAVLDAINGTLMPAIKNAELKDLVKKVAPAFQAHMIAAQTLDQKLSGKTSKGK